jgi:hypothetical protein
MLLPPGPPAPFLQSLLGPSKALQSFVVFRQASLTFVYGSVHCLSTAVLVAAASAHTAAWRRTAANMRSTRWTRATPQRSPAVTLWRISAESVAGELAIPALAEAWPGYNLVPHPPFR